MLISIFFCNFFGTKKSAFLSHGTKLRLAEKSNLYLIKLEVVSKKNYMYLRDYIKAIEEKLIAYSHVVGLSDKEVKKKFQEIFILGLENNTRSKACKFKINEFYKIIKHLKIIEKNKIIILKNKKITMHYWIIIKM